MYVASDEEINEFIERAESVLGERFSKAILYGSYARKEHTPGSDIDILILVDEKSSEDRERISEITGEFFNERNLLFSPIVLEKEEFERKVNEGYSFHEEVSREGVEI